MNNNKLIKYTKSQLIDIILNKYKLELKLRNNINKRKLLYTKIKNKYDILIQDFNILKNDFNDICDDYSDLIQELNDKINRYKTLFYLNLMVILILIIYIIL